MDSRTAHCIAKVIKEKYQILSIMDGNVQMILLYCSSGCHFPEVVMDMQNIVCLQNTCVITGDFNFDKNEENSLTQYLRETRFVQLVKNSTHDMGRTIDLCFVPEAVKEKVVLTQYSPFYSDHDALCICINLDE